MDSRDKLLEAVNELVGAEDARQKLDALEDLAREERLKRGSVTPGISAGALHATLRQKEPRR